MNCKLVLLVKFWNVFTEMLRTSNFIRHSCYMGRFCQEESAQTFDYFVHNSRTVDILRERRHLEWERLTSWIVTSKINRRSSISTRVAPTTRIAPRVEGTKVLPHWPARIFALSILSYLPDSSINGPRSFICFVFFFVFYLVNNSMKTKTIARSIKTKKQKLKKKKFCR